MSQPGQRPYRSIASVLIQRTVALAALCMLLFFGLQWWLLRMEHRERFDTLITEVADTNVPLLSVALWDIEPRAVQAQIELIARRPEIGYVVVRAKGGQEFSAGNLALADDPTAHSMPIRSADAGLELGQLTLVGDPGYLRRGLKMAALRTLLSYGTLTAAICLMMALLLKRLLHRPLSSMARFAHELTPERLTTPLQVDRPPQNHRDEIDLLEQGIGKLQTGLRTHIHHLDSLVQQRTAQLERLLEEIRHLSMTDALTGTYNRRALEDRLPGELERALRYGRPLALMFIDVDHFKQFNDVHGHAVGDQVLRAVAQHIAAHLRHHIDWIARYGGEEFVVVLPETALPAAQATAHRLCETIAREPMLHTDRALHISASFGVTAYRAGEDMPALLARADALAYDAKAAGRSRVVTAT